MGTIDDQSFEFLLSNFARLTNIISEEDVLRSVSVRWIYQNVCIGIFYQCTINNALFQFLFVMLNQKLDFSFFESFIYNKN